jgi:2,3-bisphosphoglycerate-independent phosphoglycerate mutase
MTHRTNPVTMLMILDGWGINEETKGNAFAQARTPFLDSLISTYPNCRLDCSGNAVGLPDGTMGNSEVGHMNIGAGRKVLQDFVRINTAIEDGSFFSTPALVKAMQDVADSKKSLHLTGLLSDGGVHSHISHLSALIKMARHEGVKHVYIHPILDGRDTSPTSGVGYIRQLNEMIDTIGYGQIASIVGRYWAMDRDTRWDRVQKAYDMFTCGDGTVHANAIEAVKEAYAMGQTDEFIEPTLIGTDATDTRGLVDDQDAVIFFNFRADRAKEITRAFTQKEFDGFSRKKTVRLSHFVCMTQYDENFDLPVAFGPQHLDKILGEVLSKKNISQLRIAETEKYAHVTYFFNGGDEQVFDAEDRVLIPSPRDVATYDQKPEMSAVQVADAACDHIRSGKYPFILLNFANMDMVGHTGILPAAIRACECVDQCVKKVVTAIWETQGSALITADHGNAEQMLADDGSPHTAHTLNPVRLIFAGKALEQTTPKDGILGDIAPTILKIMGIDQPGEMTGETLI